MVDDDMEDGMRRSMSEEIRRRTTIVCDGYYSAGCGAVRVPVPVRVRVPVPVPEPVAVPVPVPVR